MLFLLASLIVSVVFSATCINKDEIKWRSWGNQIYLNGNRFNMKGLSWFGFETSNWNLYGLDKHDVDWYLDWMKDRDFNAIRLPFSAQFMNSNAANRNKYKAVVEAAGEYGILIMADLHSNSAGAYTEGFYDIDYDYAISTWKLVADLLKDEYNVFMADAFNEPHDISNDNWGTWISYCEDVGKAIWDYDVSWLVAVEGTNADCGSGDPNGQWCAWGENLMGVRDKGITFDYTGDGANRFVWSPHVYGGDVTGNWNYYDSSWEYHWGYLVDSSSAAIVVGEFGTKYTGSMVGWLDSLVEYLISIDQRNTFYWCLNPNSGDTGGLLQDDWTTEQTSKLAQLSKLQPNPSVITWNSNSEKMCVDNLGETAGDPVSSPTPKPTAKPTASSNGNSDIQICVKNGANKWWYAVTVGNLNGLSVQSLEMREKNYKSWKTGTKEWDYYKWTDDSGFAGAWSFRIKINGKKTTKWSLITSTGVNEGDCGWMSVASSYTEETGVGGSGLTWGGLAAIIICSLLCIACLIGGTYYYKRVWNKHSGVASFETTGNDTPVGNDTPDGGNTAATISGYPETAGADNNDDEEEEEELEVEVEMQSQD